MLTLGWGSGPGPSSKLAQRKMTELANLLGRLASIDMTTRSFDTYDELTQAAGRGDVDLSWLPPISFLALHNRDVVVPLASVRHVPYQSAIIVHPNSPLQRPSSLLGQRAAWVDRHSASGFVVPRIKLARFGIDPRGAFAAEHFHHSHDAVVAAVVSGEADFGATWAQPGKRGAVSGPWTKTSHDVRVLATFGSIPPDVIAARADLSKEARKAIVGALKSVYGERQNRWLVMHVMGTQAFYRPNLDLYGPLQEAVVEAYQQGLLDLAEPNTGVRKTLEGRTRAPNPTIPDIIDDADIQTMEVTTAENPRWTLAEIDEDFEIDVTFD